MIALLALFLALIDPLDAERPRATVSLAFVSYSSDPDAVGFGEATKVRVDAIWVAMQDVQVRPAASCKRSTARALIAGTVTVELVKGQAAVDENAEIEVARYCAFGLQLRRARGKASGAPSELRAASIVIVGRRADGVRFLLRSRVDDALLLHARQLEGFSVSAPQTHWILGVDVSRWMSGVDFSLADATSDGHEREVRIDEKSNPELLAAFNDNVTAGFALFDDRNGDRSLDPVERAHPLASHR